MSVSVLSVDVLNNPSTFNSPFQFEICFDCQTHLQEDIDWCLTYVGSGQDKRYDQILEELGLGPIQPGITKFVLQADPPNIENIPEDDIIGATAILLTGAYRERVFFQVGYIVHNDLDESETKLDPTKIIRNVMADHPRVTLYANGWDNPDWVDFTRPQEPNLHTEDVMETEAEGDAEASGSGDSGEGSEEEDSVSDESVLSDPGEEMEDNEPQKPFKFTR